jgi:hypothetical protein
VWLNCVCETVREREREREREPESERGEMGSKKAITKAPRIFTIVKASHQTSLIGLQFNSDHLRPRERERHRDRKRRNK